MISKTMLVKYLVTQCLALKEILLMIPLVN